MLRHVSYAIDTEKPEIEYDHVGDAAFDSQGKRLAFVANLGGSTVGDSNRLPGEPGWSGGQTFIVVRQTGKVRGERTGKPFDAIRNPTWSPDGTHLAFAAKLGDGWHIVVDDTRSEAYDEVATPEFLNTGSSQVAFGARRGRDILWVRM